MALQKGQDLTLTYEGTKLGHITNISMNVDQTQINASDFDSGDFEEFLTGRKNATFSVSLNWDQADTTGQGSVVTDLLAGNTGEFVFGKETTTTGDVTFTGTGSPSSFSIDAPDDDIITASFDIQISGTLTRNVTV